MISFSDLPTLNAILNSTSVILLLCGYYFIRRRQIPIHRAFMIAAFVTSVLFFTSYVIYHAHAGSVHFRGTGPIRVVYFSILISHTILAAAVPVLATLTLVLALSKRFDKHRRIARWTLPIWLYVSATGVVIYLMLYKF